MSEQNPQRAHNTLMEVLEKQGGMESPGLQTLSLLEVLLPAAQVGSKENPTSQQQLSQKTSSGSALLLQKLHLPATMPAALGCDGCSLSNSRKKQLESIARSFLRGLASPSNTFLLT